MLQIPIAGLNFLLMVLLCSSASDAGNNSSLKDQSGSGTVSLQQGCGSCESKNHCEIPEPLIHGQVLLDGDFHPDTYKTQIIRINHTQKIVFVCDRGYNLTNGTAKSTCTNGVWDPPIDYVECIKSDDLGLQFFHSMRKRRASKTGGGIFARNQNKGPGGSGGGMPRRPTRKNSRQPEDDDISYGPMTCPSLDHDEFMVVEVIKNGENENNSYSEGSLAKISCIPGFGINLYNETVACEKGRWRPKLPQCSALPCRVPFVLHGTFYVGGKPLYFEELKPHDVRIELRCSKGFMPKGPSKISCWYGEWNILNDAPECIPGTCKLPQLGKGMYLEKYKADMIVASGTSVNYICDENYQKPYSSGNCKCDHGEWNPVKPTCISNEIFMQKNFSLDPTPVAEKGCASPPQDKLAIAFLEGLPLDFKKSHRFAHGTEVMYRCVIIRPRTKNRWKLTCENGIWHKTSSYNITCEQNVTVDDIKAVHEVTELINSNCTYIKTDENVVTFHNGHEITEEEMDFASGTILMARCVDIGKFQMRGAQKQKCSSGQWIGITPKCEGLSQYHDYSTGKSPTILFRFVNGSIAQSIDSKLIVYPGTTLHMECIYLRKFGRPQWKHQNQHRVYAEGWTDGIEGRDPYLEYRLTIDDASEADSGIFSCVTPTRHSHQIPILIKKVDCQPLPAREDLIYSSNSTKAGTVVTFSCKENNTVVGNEEIHCLASGMWSGGGLPRCEKIECPDISILPAMVSLADTEITRNGTLKRNETAPPKITIQGREVGEKALFSCPQGFKVEGESEAVCKRDGTWSNNLPLCKEVECGDPPTPENGYVKGNKPYKAGDIAEIDCLNGGFILEGQRIIVCQDSGKWSRPSTTTKCVKACNYPGSIIAGREIREVKFLYSIGESVTYSCQDSTYQLVGEKTLTCLPNGQWSHKVPECQRVNEKQ